MNEQINNERIAIGEYVGFCWNCAGRCVGKINGKYLFANDGKCIGHFNDKAELYDCKTGKYIGELAVIYQYMQEGKIVLTLEKNNSVLSYNKFERMIKNPKKSELQDKSFTCCGDAKEFANATDCIAIDVLDGYIDYTV